MPHSHVVDVLLTALAVACVLVCARRAKTPGDRSAVYCVGWFTIAMLWISPCAQLPLNEVAQERLRQRVLGFRGRPVAELEADLGPLRVDAGEGPHYLAKPWYAPVGGPSHVNVAVFGGEVVAAYVDD